MILFSSCRKDYVFPDWSTTNILPIAKTTLFATQLTEVDQIISDTTNLLNLRISNKKISVNLDSISNIPDTTITHRIDSISLINWPFPPGSSIPLINNEKIELPVNNINLKSVIVSSGFMELDIKSTLNKEITIAFDLPEATKNETSLSTDIIVQAGSILSPSVKNLSIDLSDYQIDLTNSNNDYNSLIINALASVTELNDTLYTNINDFVEVSITLIDVIPYYARGSFGNFIYEGYESINIKDEFNFDINGQLYFEEYEITCNIRNYLGIDIQTEINKISGVNSVGSIELINENIGKPINMTRALENDLNIPPTPTNYSFLFNPLNSNINELFETVPDSISFDYSVNINPQGNISLDNDFIFSDKNIEIDYVVSAPMRVAMNNLILKDTIDFSLNIDSIAENTSSVKFKLICNNGFPFEINPVVYLLDSNYNFIDSIFYDSTSISAGYLNEENIVVEKQKTTLNTDNTFSMNKLNSIKYSLVKFKLNTENYAEAIPVYANYTIDLKITAEFDQRIEIN